jgi:hypothetical protein
MFYPDICIEGLSKTKNNIRLAGLRAEFWTLYISNTRQECQPLGRDVRFAKCVIWGGGGLALCGCEWNGNDLRYIRTHDPSIC